MCDNLTGPHAPFCTPSENTRVQVGRSIEVTWDRRFFNRTTSSPSTPRQIFIQADFGGTGAADDSIGGLDGFTSNALDANSGRFTWSIIEQFLASGGAGTTSRNARLFMAEQVVDIDETGTRLPQVAQRRISTGPRVVIVSRDGGGLGDMPNPLSIALPVGLGVFAMMIIGVFFCVRRWRSGGKGVVRDGGEGGGGGTKQRRGWFGGRGYGIGKGRSQRVRGGDDIEIVHSTHMNATGGGMGMGARAGAGNVFRDEMRRQDRVRF